MDERIIKQRARENLADNWGLSIGVAAVAVLLGGLLAGGSFLPDINFCSGGETNYSSYTFSNGITINFGSGSLFGLASFIIGGVLELGYAQFLLKQHDKKPFEFNDLFSQFDRFGAGFLQQFLRGLYVFLWSLLFIIPGIIAEYSYAMTPFIMAEHPELTASEAITASKELMDGHKGELFVLNLSLLGWTLLCILTLNIGNLWLNPYRNAAYAAFYRELTSRNG